MQPDELNLLEDGLQLWLIALRNAPAPHAPLLDLFLNLATVMERSTGQDISSFMFDSAEFLHTPCFAIWGMRPRIFRYL